MTEPARQEKRQMSEAVQIHYRDAGEYLCFVKKQGWQITNYVLMALFAVFVVHKEMQPASGPERAFLLGLATVAAGLGLFYLWAIRNAARDLRVKLRNIHEDYFTPRERERLLLDNGQKRAYPGPAFTYTFIGIIVAGWAILVYLLQRG